MAVHMDAGIRGQSQGLRMSKEVVFPVIHFICPYMYTLLSVYDEADSAIISTVYVV
jgi:hypothetical protein